MAGYSGTTLVSSILTLPNEILWEIFLLLGVNDRKNFRVAAPFFRLLAVLLFRHMAVKITRNFVKEATWFVSRGNKDLSVTRMAVYSNFSRRGQSEIVKNGLEVISQSGILTNLYQLHLFGNSTEVATVLYGFQKLNITTIGSIVLPDLADIDRAIYKRKSGGLNSLLSKVEDVDIQVFPLNDGRFLGWFLGHDNLSNLKTLRLTGNGVSRDRYWALYHIGRSSGLSNSLRSLTVDNYVLDMAFFDLPLFQSATQLSEIRLYRIYLAPRTWLGSITTFYAGVPWVADDWESVIDKLDMRYRDTDCVVKVRHPRCPHRQPQYGNLAWEVMDLPSRLPHIEIENQIKD